jgi:hypothetical protein
LCCVPIHIIHPLTCLGFLCVYVVDGGRRLSSTALADVINSQVRG